MKFRPLIIVSCIAMLFAGCDKIEQSDYLVYAGASGEWNAGSGVADKSQRALIEKYTGVRCVNCPTADEAINAALGQYGDKLIAVAIHDSSFAFTRPIGHSADLRCADGDVWSTDFGVYSAGQYPAGLVNRTLIGSSWDLFTPTGGINQRVDAVVGQQATAAIAVAAEQAQGAVNITVNLEFLQAVGDELSLTLFLMEDGINATQRMPDGTDNEAYIHNHVLRDVITDVWGADVDCTGASGEKRVALFTYSEMQEGWDLSKSHIVAMLSKKASREIINVAECEIE